MEGKAEGSQGPKCNMRDPRKLTLAQVFEMAETCAELGADGDIIDIINKYRGSFTRCQYKKKIYIFHINQIIIL